MVTQSYKTTPLWRDDRFWSAIFQVIVVAIVLSLYGVLLYTFNLNLNRTGLNFSFGFLTNPSGFSIGETLFKYETNDPYIWGLVIGAINTFRLVIVAFFATTAIGVVVGVCSFSQNLLLRLLSQVYVEIIRNTPLLLQLLFWYFVVFLSLPKPREPSIFANAIFLSKAGVMIPWPSVGARLWWSLGVLLVTTIALFVTWRWRIHAIVRQGQTGQLQLFLLLAFAVLGIFIILFGFHWEVPSQAETGLVSGGLTLSIEYSAVFAGLVVYTAAFIAEIVRGGIQSVSKGQWEAARSLGLSAGQVMQLVVFPQALRVIIPPLNSQYMNLAKNSSLALAIGYPDLYSVASTTLNQTGRPMEVFLILMAFYLSLNLIITIVMNTVNRLVQIQER
jgi:general L-amino acid transport system permease protein